jgi:hypothetical protein
MIKNRTRWRVGQARSAQLIASICLAAAGLVHAQIPGPLQPSAQAPTPGQAQAPVQTAAPTLRSPSAYATPPNQSVAEAQRRRNNAQRRRAREATENAQNAALLLSAAQAAPAAPAPRTFHRHVHMLRRTTPLGRRAVQPPAPVPAAPPAAAP